jgi:hypothetical protein
MLMSAARQSRNPTELYRGDAEALSDYSSNIVTTTKTLIIKGLDAM